ncbi:hypothetical protein DICPUDRAFT_36456 [Dictyostelium purpureum]|uniref:Uncharacterized protein n=1 Tax=Dictyostelium purpureum TaxID=5786 RepID=F0ZR36_DICPU|nr:uncharacterized protein DICPUDRAFT_36456 [Dictyostelium purpureum]EGC33605.1 hypothetical protein DICPUDRAFT_36456 [Dictyostelium purpureum]|eukprot:XP_003289873.1 hypothetical protein DICPUDRAFT_36456 [Dictyostelium purpureum]
MYNNQIILEIGNTKNNFENNIPVIFEFSKSTKKKHIYYLKYEPSLNKWTTKFRVPGNLMEGPVAYRIYPSWINHIEIPSSSLPGECQLNVTSNYFDYMGPVVSNIEKIPDSLSQGSKIFGWYLTIVDETNGFKKGNCTVTGSLDNSVYNYDLSLDTSLLDTPFITKFKILVSIPFSCTTMNYSITSLYLEDSQGQYTSFNNFNYIVNYPQLNPFINFMGKTNYLSYEISCIQPLDYSTYPSIVTWSPSEKSIDVSSEKSLYVNFDVEDVNGLKIDQLPVLYVIGYELQIIESKCQLMSQVPPTYSYFCEILIPFGFGFLNGNQSLSLSLYGLISNNVSNKK